MQKARTGNVREILIFPSTVLCFQKSIKVCAGMQHNQVAADKNRDIKGNRTSFSTQAQYCLVTTSQTALTTSVHNIHIQVQTVHGYHLAHHLSRSKFSCLWLLHNFSHQSTVSLLQIVAQHQGPRRAVDPERPNKQADLQEKLLQWALLRNCRASYLEASQQPVFNPRADKDDAKT